VHDELRLGDSELGRRLLYLAGERVRREAVGQRACGDREGDIADLRPGVDESRERSPATELAVVGVRGEDERPPPLEDQTGTASLGAAGADSRAGATAGSDRAVSPINAHVIGSSKNAL
jgi:hypothetical protein